MTPLRPDDGVTERRMLLLEASTMLRCRRAIDVQRHCIVSRIAKHLILLQVVVLLWMTHIVLIVIQIQIK